MFDKIKQFFQEKAPAQTRSLITTDIHSHLLPGIDDGVETFDESLEVVNGFISLGYTRLITTPHIMQDYYRNEPEEIRELAALLQSKIYDRGWDITVEAAAEYYLDEGLMEKLENEDELLTFGNNYLLFETSFINKPIYIEEFLFKTMSRGYTPVMAHPERYAYIHNEPNLLQTLMDRGMLSQVNANSFAGYYSKEVKKMARRIIDSGLVNFVGSDCHSMKHLEVLRDVISDPYFVKASGYPLLNSDC
jgi:tyrosine-protein phosphatase YwqE